MYDKPIVLLAEDDPNDEDLVRLALSESRLDCELDVVHDGAELIDYLFAAGPYVGRDVHRLPRLLLLDLKMPRMNGLQVLQVLRRVHLDNATPLPPIVALTSSREEHDVSEAYHWGVQSYIAKPVNFEQFARTVRQVATYWLTLNEPPRGRGRHELNVPA